MVGVAEWQGCEKIVGGCLDAPAEPQGTSAAHFHSARAAAYTCPMRSRFVVLWILLALLPLRGWAYGNMQVGMAAAAVAMAAQNAESPAAAPVAMPCHEAASATDARPGADPDADSANSGHTACALCDLCHSVALFSAASPLGETQLAVSRVRPVTGIDTGRALVGGLERPPRFFFA